jgi:putative redox protein
MADKTVSLTWLRDQTFSVASGSHSMILDNPVDGNERRGPSPMDMALAALAGCTVIDIVSILGKQRQDLRELRIHVKGERADDHPRRYTRVVVTYELHGKNLNPRSVERAVMLSDEKYCSVSATFREVTEVESRFEIVEVGEEG